MMHILVVNDDGISSEGIACLARIAKDFGDVTVVAPASQCSGMSQHMTVHGKLELCRIKDYPVSGVKAYSITGTPADCVRAGVDFVLDKRPDYIFSGINDGFNIGKEILYSGTVGAAQEGLANGIPAAAFSIKGFEYLSAAEEYLPGIIKDILSKETEPWEFWNVNIPGALPSEIKGIVNDFSPSAKPYYKAGYFSLPSEDADKEIVEIRYQHCDEPEDGSDIYYMLNKYITSGKIGNNVLRMALERN